MKHQLSIASKTPDFFSPLFNTLPKYASSISTNCHLYHRLSTYHLYLTFQLTSLTQLTLQKRIWRNVLLIADGRHKLMPCIDQTLLWQWKLVAVMPLPYINTPLVLTQLWHKKWAYIIAMEASRYDFLVLLSQKLRVLYW